MLGQNWDNTENDDVVYPDSDPINNILYSRSGRVWNEMSLGQKVAALIITALTVLLSVAGFSTWMTQEIYWVILLF